jgi:hypothetical protein
LAPTVRATNKPLAMAAKRASSKAAPSVDEAAKAALLAEKKGKALADTTHQEACEDDAVSKRQRHDQPTPEGSLHTYSSGGQPQEPPPGFAPLEGEDAIEDGEVIGVSAKEQLQLWAPRIKNRNLQKQKEILEAKHQRVSAQAKVRQMIRDEEQRAQELEQEIALMQREGQHDLQHGTARPSNSARQLETYSFLSADPSSRTPQHSKASTTLMSGVPWRRNCKCHHGPPTSG